MAEVQVKEEKGGKTRQKKQHLRVDFTPMVDMNMLLITFFMFCTTLLKPQTMNLVMPTKDEVDPEHASKARESTAVTVLLGANDEIYYYLGMIDAEGKAYDDPSFLVATTYTEDGLRKLLLEKNRGTFELIQELKLKKKNLEINEEEFNEQSKAIQEVALKEKKIAPTIIVKPTEFASYKNMVEALDEMLICNIGVWAIDDKLEDGDRYLLFKKTNNADYLTESQRAMYVK